MHCQCGEPTLKTMWTPPCPPSPSGLSLTETCLFNVFLLAIHPQTSPGLPAQAKKHAESAKNTLLTWKGNTALDKEKEEILEALVMLYYTLGVAWLLQRQYPFLPRGVWWSGPGATHARWVTSPRVGDETRAGSSIPTSGPSVSLCSPSRKVQMFLSVHMSSEWSHGKLLTRDMSPGQLKGFGVCPALHWAPPRQYEQWGPGW